MSARPGLCGGQSAMVVPTAISQSLAPLPKLLPQLHERLHLSRARDPRVNQTALLERAIVELPHAIRTQVRDPVTKLFAPQRPIRQCCYPLDLLGDPGWLL